jgi:hypothetical protein
MGFDSRQVQKIFLFSIVHIGYEAHPASYPVGNGVSFLGNKAAGA